MGKRNPCDDRKDSVTALGHPSISPDGKYLYFVSDAVGGFGGKDIFRARVAGNDFGPMENLGEEINTPGDEMFPYVRDSVTFISRPTDIREWAASICSRPRKTVQGSEGQRT